MCFHMFDMLLMIVVGLAFGFMIGHMIVKRP
jgi:hypothetical protein